MDYPIIDMHCDTLLKTLAKGKDFVYNGEGMTSIRQMKDAGQMCQFFAIFFPPRGMSLPQKKGEPPVTLPEDEEFFSLLRKNLLEVVEEHKELVQMAYNGDDIIKNHKQGKLSAVLTIEDGRMVNGKMERLIQLKKEGVTAISLTWNSANCFGAPNSKDTKIMETGLTAFGKEAVSVMNDQGILIDVSHLSDGGFYDVAKLSKKPFIASHSNCRALSPHTRNLTDDMIRVLAEHGGVSGINFAPEFLAYDTTSTKTMVAELVNHVLHFIQIGGEDVVGFGTDFDGIRGIFEIGHPGEMGLLFDALKKKGVTERQLDKFASENVLRVLKEAL